MSHAEVTRNAAGPAGRGYAAAMSSPSKTLLPYRCQFFQLHDGTWLAEDWRVVGLAATGRTREECGAKIRDLIMEDARGELGSESAALALAISEYDRPGNVVEYLVTGRALRPMIRTNA